jgi:hypothetical protein
LSSEEVHAKTELSKCQELKARACNVSVSTVASVLKEGKILTTDPLVNTLGSKNKYDFLFNS